MTDFNFTSSPRSAMGANSHLPNSIQQEGLIPSDELKQRLEDAKEYALKIQPILQAYQGKGEPIPDIPPEAVVGHPLASTGVDKAVLYNLSHVYIGSISFDLTKAHIRAVFAEYGFIRDLSMNLDTTTGRHKGFCFIEYEVPEAGNLAVETLHGAILGGRALRVGRPSQYNPANLAKLPPAPEGRLYIANVNEHVNEENLASIFQAFGQLSKCILIPDPLTRKHKGYGFVEFEQSQVASMALGAMNGFDLGGMSLRLRKAMVGGPLPEGMSLLEKIPEFPAAPCLITPLVEPPVEPATLVLPKTGMGHVGGGDSTGGYVHGNPAYHPPPPNDTVSGDSNIRIDSQQRLDLMQKLSQRATSTVLCVSNVIDLADVDDELSEEFGEECAKFGQVVNVLVHTDAQVEPQEQVKIFVQFTDTAGSQNAMSVLNGRWFGGRQLMVKYYDQDKFYARNFTSS
ncbi:hypothetical protein IWQ61_005545 [Dispira simplex]|nr:hypothetical protein IWQ61_005545 [Dispira simplex]